MWLRRLLFLIDGIVILVLLSFFIGGTQTSNHLSYFALWLPLLGAPIGIMIAAWTAVHRGRGRLSTALLSTIAVPAVAFIAVFSLLILANPHWN